MSQFAPRNPQAKVLFDEMARWPVFDPHSHIDPISPAAYSLDEILGYHYYTELAHSAGMPSAEVSAQLDASQRVRNLGPWLERFDNTVQYAWFLEIAQAFHNVADPLAPGAMEELESRANRKHDGAEWDRRVWQTTNLDVVFLTNDFDDPLEGWDTSKYVPCLRVDDLVLKLHEPSTLRRLRAATNCEVGDHHQLKQALGALFDRFTKRGARACAVSLPPDFAPTHPTPKRAVTPLRRALQGLPLRPDELLEVRANVFWMIAEFCAEYRLPFDLMIGPARNVYQAGVDGGRDLFDRRVSLHDYRSLFNHFREVTFPVSTLSPDAGAELVAYSWIFPNVLPMGHWWYSNLPAYIEPDLRARLQGIPKTKPVGYYSDAYKLEFVLPKFNMYRSVLADVLADDAIGKRGFSEKRALDVARALLIENPKRIFSM
jgi:glucuronate isomerase